MFSRQEWKLVARDALAIYLLSHLLRLLMRAPLGLPELPSVQAQLVAAALSLSFSVMCFGLVAFYTTNVVWKHLLAVAAILWMASIAGSAVRLPAPMNVLPPSLILPLVVFPLIHYALTASIGGYLGKKFRRTRN